MLSWGDEGLYIGSKDNQIKSKSLTPPLRLTPPYFRNLIWAQIWILFGPKFLAYWFWAKTMLFWCSKMRISKGKSISNHWKKCYFLRLRRAKNTFSYVLLSIQILRILDGVRLTPPYFEADLARRGVNDFVLSWSDLFEADQPSSMTKWVISFYYYNVMTIVPVVHYHGL